MSLVGRRAYAELNVDPIREPRRILSMCYHEYVDHAREMGAAWHVCIVQSQCDGTVSHAH